MKIVGYRCDWPECEFLTCRKYVMVNHINGKHTNQRPYSCPLCNFNFVKRYFLKAHMHKVHKQRVSGDKKEEEEESDSPSKRDLLMAEEGHEGKKARSHSSAYYARNGDSYSAYPDTPTGYAHYGQYGPGQYGAYGEASVFGQDNDSFGSDLSQSGLHPANPAFKASHALMTPSPSSSGASPLPFGPSKPFQAGYDPPNAGFEGYYPSGPPRPPPPPQRTYPAAGKTLPAKQEQPTPPLPANCCRSAQGLPPTSLADAFQSATQVNHTSQPDSFPFDPSGGHAYSANQVTSGHNFDDFLSPPSSISSSGSNFSGCYSGPGCAPADQMTTARPGGRPLSNTPTSIASASSFYLHTPSPSPSSLSHSPAAASTYSAITTTTPTYCGGANPAHYPTNFANSFTPDPKQSAEPVYYGPKCTPSKEHTTGLFGPPLQQPDYPPYDPAYGSSGFCQPEQYGASQYGEFDYPGDPNKSAPPCGSGLYPSTPTNPANPPFLQNAECWNSTW